jgi:hypothetical protein
LDTILPRLGVLLRRLRGLGKPQFSSGRIFTESSNPSPSSEESIANVIFGDSSRTETRFEGGDALASRRHQHSRQPRDGGLRPFLQHAVGRDLAVLVGSGTAGTRDTQRLSGTLRPACRSRSRGRVIRRSLRKRPAGVGLRPRRRPPIAQKRALSGVSRNPDAETSDDNFRSS